MWIVKVCYFETGKETILNYKFSSYSEAFVNYGCEIDHWFNRLCPFTMSNSNITHDQNLEKQNRFKLNVINLCVRELSINNCTNCTFNIQLFEEEDSKDDKKIN